MARRVITDLRQAERLLNRALALSGTPTRYLVQGRNGYQGIDRFAADDVADGDTDSGRSRWTQRATLSAGHSVDTATLILEGMLDAVERVTEGAVITRQPEPDDFGYTLVETGPKGHRVRIIARTDIADALAEAEARIAYYVREGWTTTASYGPGGRVITMVRLGVGGAAETARLEIVRDLSR